MPITSHDFVPTRWSLILTAQDPADPTSRRALEELFGTYWYPLYAFLRRHGESPEQSEDITQSFFASLLERNSLADLNPAKGRFRAFLLASLKHFLSNHRAHARAQKRSPQKLISLDSAESRYTIEPVDNVTPEKLFERRWALAVLDHVLKQLEADYASRDESKIFHALKEVLTQPKPTRSYAQIAAALGAGATESSVKTAASRLRRRYRELLRDQIAQTVASPDEVDEEIAYLLNSL